MSSNLEESPLSDGKMDISDATNSFESAAVSPVIDSEHSNNHSRNSIDEASLHACEISSIISTAIPKDDSYNVGVEVASVNQLKSSLNESEELQSRFKNHTTFKHDDASQEIILDNRCVENLCRPALLPLSEKHLCNLTVANSHPLMSPTGTDSDSENSCLVQGEANRKCQNFPDVVPNRDRHMSQDTPSALCYKLPVNDAKTTIQRVETSSLVSAKNTLNINKALISKNKLSLLRAHSPDILSSGSEADTSLYHAAVEVDFQSVALIPNTNNTIPSKINGTLGKRNGEIAPAGSDDISSLDSISNHSFDDEEDLEHNLASLSPSSSLIDVLDDDNDDECEGPEIDDDFPERTTPTNMKAADVLPQYSAEEERRDSRNWQKITLPDGSTREIDMKVIEPYKRVLSHGGYLKAGGHNAIVLFCACHLPDRSRADYHYVMDNLFLYVVKTLEQLVTEDYVLIYLHGGSSRRNVPPFPWLKKCYLLLDRRLRKSLKNMYLVHPTFWIKSIVWMARPFVSAKFWRKLIYVKSLHELCTHVDVEKAAIPDKVKLYDAKHN